MLRPSSRNKFDCNESIRHLAGVCREAIGDKEVCGQAKPSPDQGNESTPILLLKNGGKEKSKKK